MAETSLTRKTAIAAVWMVAWRLFTRILGLTSTLILARLLTPADFGIVAMATLFSSVIDAFSELGLQDALVRHPNNDRQLFNTAFTLQLMRSAVIAAILAAGSPIGAWWFDEPRLTNILLCLSGITFITGLENVAIAEFRREMRYDKQFFLLTAPRLLQVAITIPLALELQSYWALIVGIFVGKVLRVATTYIVHPFRPSFRLAGWRELAGFSFWTWASSTANVVWERCDAVVLGPVLGPAGLGLYLVAFETAILPVSELIAPTADALFAGFSAALKRGPQLSKTASEVATTLLLGVAPITIAISATSGYIVAALLGPKWQAAQALIAILTWQCLFSPFSYVCTRLLVAKGFVRLSFFGNALAAATRLIATIIVVSITSHIDYVAITITFVVAIEALIYIFMLRRAGDTGLRGVSGVLLRISIAAALSIVAVAISGYGWKTVTMPALPALVQGGLVGCGALGCFAIIQLLQWLIVGRPRGPETALLQVAGNFLGWLRLRAKPRPYGRI